ncbi:unnamed protein product [Linum tenue]|uniref:Uncharacterized protein n=2 Tax=Linum tenue TaxID=586396 RepID=A0AAV0JDH6_9ROSI|nr:unnamed protein product [Linum tenue]
MITIQPSFITSPSTLFHRRSIKSQRRNKPMFSRCCLVEKHAQKLEEAQRSFMVATRKERMLTCPVETLVMIDAVQRLGIDYHFQENIDAVLSDEFSIAAKMAAGGSSHGLFEVSLNFRLMRQQGYRIPSDVFGKFKNGEGKFNPNLGQGVEAMMELYEASQWITPGESTLREARDFSSHWLRSWIAKELATTTETVANTLKHPCRRSIPRLAIKDYLSSFAARTPSNETLKDLAKLDFNMNQATRQQELLQISKWWNEIGLAVNHGRDHLQVEAYLWPMSTLAGPGFSEYRIDLAKITSFVYLIDDIFDIHGSSLDELTLFTHVVTRWDIKMAEELPDYMRKCFMALYHMINQIGYDVHKKHGYNSIHSLQRGWAKLVEAFLVEAKWMRNGTCPTSENYLKNGIASSGVQLVLLHFFFLLGQGITKQNVSLVDGDDPPLISSVAKILRLSDDLSSTYDEHVGYDASYVDCYMKENPGLSVREASEHVMDMIEETWEQLNHESLATKFPVVFARAVVDSARMVPFVYGNDGSFDDDNEKATSSFPSLQDRIKSLLFESIPI